MLRVPDSCQFFNVKAITIKNKKHEESDLINWIFIYNGNRIEIVIHDIVIIHQSTVWCKIIFWHFNGYSIANMQDIDKIPFDYCLDINS